MHNQSPRAGTHLHILSTLWIFLTACGTNSNPASPAINQLQADVEALCEVYNADNWNDYTGPRTLIAIHQEVAVRARNAGTTDAYRGILDQLAKVEPEELYTTVKERIEEETGRGWQCEDMRQFYQASYQSKSSGEKPVSIIHMHPDGKFSRGNSPERYDTVAGLLAATLLSPGHKLQVHMGAKPDGQQAVESLNLLLEQLNAQGITQVDIVETATQ